MAIAFTYFDSYSEILSHLFCSRDAYKAHLQMKTDFSNMISGRESGLATCLLVIFTSPKAGLHLQSLSSVKLSM